jgi:hypothetical protein
MVFDLEGYVNPIPKTKLLFPGPLGLYESFKSPQWILPAGITRKRTSTAPWLYREGLCDGDRETRLEPCRHETLYLLPV